MVANNGSDTVSILRGAGNGTFAAPVNYGAGSSPASTGVGDFDGDGKDDLAVVHSEDGNVSILLNTSTPGAARTVAAAPVPALDPMPLALLALMLGAFAALAMRPTRGRQAPTIHPSTGSMRAGRPQFRDARCAAHPASIAHAIASSVSPVASSIATSASPIDRSTRSAKACAPACA